MGPENIPNPSSANYPHGQELHFGYIHSTVEPLVQVCKLSAWELTEEEQAFKVSLSDLGTAT